MQVMKIAFVYDRVNKIGGAERVLLALHEIYPNAPLFTSVYNKRTATWAKVFPQIFTSFLQKIPIASLNHEFFPLFMPIAFESFDFSDYDLVISITSEAAKGIVTKPPTRHVCYCLTPTRYLWSGRDQYFQGPLGFFAKPAINYLKKWDMVAGQRPDEFLAISKIVQERIKKYYGRESKVIYPPVDTDKFEITTNRQSPTTNHHSLSTSHQPPITNYFLVVSRLVKYKKVDLVIKAFNQLGWNLKIVGVGREMGNLRKIAKGNIEFLGQLTDEDLLRYYQESWAVVFPQIEDFGIVPLEAQACGKPVIAFNQGGARETIIDGKTGILFDKQSPECLMKTLVRFDILAKEDRFRQKDCRENSEKFNKERFKKEFINYIEQS